MRSAKVVLVSAIGIVVGSCGQQSALDPAGRDAEVVAALFWWMLGGATVLWLLMNGVFLYVTRATDREFSARTADWFIIGGGIVFPTVVLAGLLSYALAEMPRQREVGSGVEVRITGESWWWRVAYLPPGADVPIMSANELRLPIGSRAEIKLAANGVIHSFWIPALGGKTDMIPGRETRMSLEPTTPGEYRGQCTEFCGESHALMAFKAVVMEPDGFDAWLARQAEAAKAPSSEGAVRGRAVFAAEGCGGCHTIRGTPAAGRMGPDLTHLADRRTLAAGVLPMTTNAMIDWLREPAAIKPGVRMPGYGHLSDADLSALAAYLMGLS